MSVQSQRGRRVARRERNPLTIFYLVVGGVLLVGAAFLVAYAVLGGFSQAQVTTINAPVGQTSEGFWYKGNPDAAVKVIGYEDYQCPACAAYEKQLAKLIDRDYIETGKIQFIYHEFPLDIHPHAVVAGEAARCAGDQGQYWTMHDMLFINQGQWYNLNAVENVFAGYAGQLGMDRGAFEGCLNGNTHEAAVIAAGEASMAAGAQATPTFSVNGQLVDSSNLVAMIDAALSAAGQ